MQKKGHYAVKGHSSTFNVADFGTNRTVSKLLQIIGQICAFNSGEMYLSLTHSLGVNL